MPLPSPDQVQYMEAHINDTKVPSILAANIISGVIAYIAVFLRVLSRRSIKASFDLDDWLIVVTLITFTGFVISFSLSTAYGAGRHVILVTNPMVLQQLNLADEALYSATILLIKYSLLSLYGRIFSVASFRPKLYLVAGLVAAWFFASIFGSIFQCIPISALWDLDQAGFCIQYGIFTLVIGIINIITDFIILLLPVQLILGLHLRQTKKVLIMLTFFAGSMACIVSIVRLAYAQQVGPEDSDESWDEMTAGMLSTVEQSIGILAVCIPTYGPLFNRTFRQNRNTIGSHGNAKSASDGCDAGQNSSGRNGKIVEMIPMSIRSSKAPGSSSARDTVEDDEERLTWEGNTH